MSRKGKLTTSPNQKAYYSNYKSSNRQHLNRFKKLISHINKFPGDEAAKNALSRLEKGSTYRRRKAVKSGLNTKFEIYVKDKKLVIKNLPTPKVGTCVHTTFTVKGQLHVKTA